VSTPSHADCPAGTASVTVDAGGSVSVHCPSPGCDWSHTERNGFRDILAVLLSARAAWRMLDLRAAKAERALAEHLDAATAAGENWRAGQ
jgi:hypothetical protein